MNKRSILALLLAALLTMSTVGCGNATTDETTGTETADTTTPVETEEAVTFDSVARSYQDRDYDGYTFRIADRDAGTWQTVDVYAEEITGEVINDAVYNRNTALEESMNIVITEIRCDGPANTLKTAVLAGTDDYDTATDGLSAVSPFVSQNILMDYRNIASIHAEADYWDAQLYNDSTIMGHSFFMTGDISIMDNHGTWCMLFNKDLITNHGLESPYDLVNDGKWTLDKMDEMAQAVLNDTDGDGAWTDADTYGYLTEDYNNLALWSCCGFKIMDSDEDGLPYFTYNSEASLDALTRVLEVQFADYTNMGSKSSLVVGAFGDGQTTAKQFSYGKALFVYGGMMLITMYREYDTDFGVIPAPKYNEEQERYYTNYSFSNFTVYVVPTTASDPEMIGDIMDAMANLSKYSLTPAYYDQTLIGKSTRDEESEPMIELILNTRNFDLGIIFDTGSIRTAIMGLRSADKITSTLAAKESSAATALDKFIEDLSELQQ